MLNTVSRFKMSGLFPVALLLVFLCASAFGGNVAPLGTCSAGSSYAGYPCGLAIDNTFTIASEWVSNGLTADWWQVKLDKAYQIGNINVYGWGHQGLEEDFSVYVSLSPINPLSPGTPIYSGGDISAGALWSRAIGVNSSIQYIEFAATTPAGAKSEWAALVELTADTVPEPGTLVFMGTGAVALGMLLRRRRRATL